MACGASGTASGRPTNHAAPRSSIGTNIAIRTVSTVMVTVTLLGTDSQLFLNLEPSWSGACDVIC